ncbi:MAG: phosphomethylpyrimidine synthase ThiC [Bacillota bacterium]|nr:phosphomethylpyrimidine synthase ThiC [Bacillota bacterium]MDW7683648.1 phosphomethylpyrimidine synthase ThiC [Bacillota bacterium]
MTQLIKARQHVITREMERAAKREGVSPELIRARLADGTIVIPANINHKSLEPCAIGQGMRTKVNANIGTSTDFPDPDAELAKLRQVVDAGADAVMDLSTGPNITDTRRRMLAASPLPVGTVPVYQATADANARYGAMVKLTADDLFDVIEEQCADGVDFITVHCGVTRQVVDTLRKRRRVADIVSRGGAFLTGWMLHHDVENPLYERYDELLDIALRYDVTLSLGDGLRPGCLADATDGPQVQELLVLGELVERAWERGVQVMVEGPGHVPLHQVRANVELQKSLCKGAPFYVLGPLVTDVAPGYDHITSAIGGALAAWAGADFLCYVTPAEHLGLPDAKDVRDGIMASRIAAHAADIAKGVPGALEWDLSMAKARKALDWQKQIELSVDPAHAAAVRKEKNPDDRKECSMCGEFCAMRVVAEALGTDPETC